MKRNYNSANAVTGGALTAGMLPLNSSQMSASAIANAADRIIQNQAISTRVQYTKSSMFQDIIGKFPTAGPLLFHRVYSKKEKRDRGRDVIIHVSQLNTLFDKQKTQIQELLTQPNIQSQKDCSIASLLYWPDLTKEEEDYHLEPNAYRDDYNAFTHRTDNVFERYPYLYNQDIMLTPSQAVTKWKFFGAIHVVHTESTTPEINVLVGKRCMVTNYWGPVASIKPMQYVGFIIRYKNKANKETGEYSNAERLEIVPWHGTMLPGFTETVRKDWWGNLENGIIITVGQVVDYTNHYISDSPGLLNANETEVAGLLKSNGSFLVLNMHVQYQE